MDTFFVGVGFVVFLGILGYFGVHRMLLGMLDSRAAKVREQLDAAASLRREAEALLKEYEAKRAAAEKDAQQIVADAKAEAVAELMLEVAQCFFRIRDVGQKSGLITSWGAGSFGFLRSLALEGPLTVPQIAAMRPTSRQRMQRLADELAAEGLVAFLDNPKHRRSKLVRLTPAGERRYREMAAKLLAIAVASGGSLDAHEVKRSTMALRLLGEGIGETFGTR